MNVETARTQAQAKKHRDMTAATDGSCCSYTHQDHEYSFLYCIHTGRLNIDSIFAAQMLMLHQGVSCVFTCSSFFANFV